MNTQGSPLRALASGYLVPLFDTEKTEYPGGVMDIMKPFTPYYIKRKEGEALLLAEEPGAPESLSYWARKGDCYVWATGQVVEVTSNLAVYHSEQDAVAGRGAVDDAKAYVDPQGIRLPSNSAGRAQPLSRLPVLSRSAQLCAFLSPARGGELCWINLSNDGNALVWGSQ